MRWWLLVVPVLAAGPGCNGERALFASVSGTVTLNGKPLPDAYVTFQPITSPESTKQAPGSYGKTDADGKFTLRVVGRDYQGAVVGKHTVFISAPIGSPPAHSQETAPRRPDRVPARYNTQTILTCEVPPEGTSEANFPLTAP